jgi:hypothetical protein
MQFIFVSLLLVWVGFPVLMLFSCLSFRVVPWYHLAAHSLRKRTTRRSRDRVGQSD